MDIQEFRFSDLREREQDELHRFFHTAAEFIRRRFPHCTVDVYPATDDFTPSEDLAEGPDPSRRVLPIRSLTNEDTVLATLVMQVKPGEMFGPDDGQMMETIVEQLGLAIENIQQKLIAQRRLEEFALLYRLAEKMNTSLNVYEALDTIVQSLKQAMGCRGCSIALLDPVENILEIYTAAGLESRWVRDFRLRLGEGVAGRVALEGKPIYVPDVSEWEDFIVFDASVRSLLTVPLQFQQRVIGTLSVDSDRPNAFTPDDERLLTIAATQAAIAIENARLYESLEQHTQHLTKAYAELKRAGRVKDEVVRNLSHELRSPLTFVKSYIELLLGEQAGPLLPEQRAYLEIVAQKTNTLMQLMTDIMALQQKESPPLALEVVSPVEIARRSIQAYQIVAIRAGVRLMLRAPDDVPMVVGDPARLLQVFDHLLNNAIKFSPDGGQVMVAIHPIEDEVQVSVSNQGAGIPEEQLEYIFERFYQVNSSIQRRFGDGGLGLAIVRQIIEAHNGRVWAESKPGEGSTFYFVLPQYRGSLDG